MARKRSISTEISTDPKIADLAAYGALPVAIYMMAIPHADDYGCLTADPRQFRLLVCPCLDVTSRDVEQSIQQIASVGLWTVEDRGGRLTIQFPLDAWFRHQSYIGAEKRARAYNAADLPVPPRTTEEQRETPQNGEEQRGTAENRASPSPSPSPTKTLPPTPQGEGECSEFSGGEADPEGEHSQFTEFWQDYPRKDDRIGASREWKRQVRGPQQGGKIILALRAQLAAGMFGGETEFVPYAKTYLRNHRWEEVPPNSTSPPKDYDAERAATCRYLDEQIARTKRHAAAH